ncbi:MAG: cell division protein FtsW [Chloroflexi bacterium]|nr:cell division protein FtsW [Chloroflexota bacterium]
MAEQSATPQFIEDTGLNHAEMNDPVMPVIAGGRMLARGGGETEAIRRPRRLGLLATFDGYLLVVTLILVAIGCMMVYSTTFDWGYQDFDNEAHILMLHVRNLAVAAVPFIALMLIDYRTWRRFAVLLLLGTIGVLIAVLLFGDDTFNARRSLFQGSYQPGELAELVVVIYMAAWLGSKRTRVASIFNGLLPFIALLVLVGVPIILQPDLSTAATIFVVAGIMYFLAGANIMHLAAVAGLLAAAGWFLSQNLIYAGNRVGSFIAGLTDVTQSSDHAQQAIIAFMNGGWTGVGLGQGRQKFGALPVPHTDSVFAVIGEELGVIGAAFVVLLYVVLLIRGLQVARRAPDSFGALLASGITLWLIVKALLNIAVMLNILPTTGVTLPFVSYGGSSLVTALAGVALILSVSRVTALQNSPEGRNVSAHYDRGWGNRWSRLSGHRHRRRVPQAAPRR